MVKKLNDPVRAAAGAPGQPPAPGQARALPKDLGGQIDLPVPRLPEADHLELPEEKMEAVAEREGKPLLRDAQEQLRASEAMQRQAAETQAAILDALPAHIALVDRAGLILTVNASWRRHATASLLGGCGVGRNYLEACARAEGDGSAQARAAAIGIRRVLEGEAAEFTPVQSSACPWLQLDALTGGGLSCKSDLKRLWSAKGSF